MSDDNDKIAICSFSGLPLPPNGRRHFEPMLGQSGRKGRGVFLDANCLVAALMTRKPRQWREKIALLQQEAGGVIEPATVGGALLHELGDAAAVEGAEKAARERALRDIGGTREVEECNQNSYKRVISQLYSEPVKDFLSRQRYGKKRAKEETDGEEVLAVSDATKKVLAKRRKVGSSRVATAEDGVPAANDANIVSSAVSTTTTTSSALPAPPQPRTSADEPYTVIVTDCGKRTIYTTRDWMGFLRERYQMSHGMPALLQSNTEFTVFPWLVVDASRMNDTPLRVTIRQQISKS